MSGDRLFYTKDHKTIDMFDHYAYLGPKRRELLDTSWAKLFRDEVLPNLPIDILISAYHDSLGRPSKELYALLGVMLLQQMEDLTDEEATKQFAFNILWRNDSRQSGQSLCGGRDQAAA